MGAEPCERKVYNIISIQNISLSFNNIHDFYFLWATSQTSNEIFPLK